MDKNKAVVFEVEKFATHDGPGIRTVVFLKGCPLRCMWCHSPESWNPRIEQYSDGTIVGRLMSIDAIMAEILQDKDFYDMSGGGLTISGGEPMSHWEFVATLLGRAKAAGLHTAVETSGYAAPMAVATVAEVADLWLYDIKGLDPDLHRKHTGADNGSILRNLRWLNAHGAKIVLRCPMIPNVNDSETNLVALAHLADELENVDHMDVEPFVPYGVDKARKLGLKVYEALSPDPDYASRIIAKLSPLTIKHVHVG